MPNAVPNAWTDSDIVDMMAVSLLPGRTSAVRRLFEAAGSNPPAILWAPGPGEIQNPVLARFSNVCRGLADETNRVPFEKFSLDAVSDMLDFCMLVLPVQGGADFRYAHYGAAITRNYGKDMTGSLTSDIGGHISRFFTALYRAIMRRQEWVLSVHSPPCSVFVQHWHRLIVPLSAGDTVAAFAVCNVAVNPLTAGLEAMPVPVIVADGGGMVRFANTPALGFLGNKVLNRKLNAFVDMPSKPLPAPEALVASGAVERGQITLPGRQRVKTKIDANISAAVLADRAFYIVMLEDALTCRECERPENTLNERT